MWTLLFPLLCHKTMLKSGPYSFHMSKNHVEIGSIPFPHMRHKAMLISQPYPFYLWHHAEISALPFSYRRPKTMLKSQPYPFHICVKKPCWNWDLTLSKCVPCIHAELPSWWGSWALAIAPVVYPTAPPWNSPIWCVLMSFHPRPVQREGDDEQSEVVSRIGIVLIP